MNQDKNTAFIFNAANIKPMDSMEIVPAGWYVCEITDAEIKATGKGKASQGLGVFFKYRILSGDYKNRMIFGGCINVQNASADCQNIGQRELSSICHAVQVISIDDLQVFVGKQLEVKVKIQKASESDLAKGYEDKNETKGYKACENANANSGPSFPQGTPSAPVMQAVIPPVVPPTPPAPVVPPVVVFPPDGWIENPNGPGWFYNALTGEQLTEADLRKVILPPTPPAPPAMAIPAVPTVAKMPWE